MYWLKLAAVATLLSAPALAQEAAAPDATASLVNAAGEPVGEASVTDSGSGVLVALEIRDMPPGQWVAVHIHETGDCAPEGGFEAAGGHFNPSDAEHGYYSDGGPHAGDMPNQNADSEGVLQAQIFNPLVRVGEGPADIAGRAILVHAMADDYQGQPSGHAGDRLACGVIEPAAL